MTIATKNGSVILKDGSVAQNCGCCGGWWCYPPNSCGSPSADWQKCLSQIRVTIQAEDLFYKYQGVSNADYTEPVFGISYPAGTKQVFTTAWAGSRINGTKTLSKVSDRVWMYSLPLNAPYCQSQFANTYYGNGQAFYGNYVIGAEVFPPPAQTIAIYVGYTVFRDDAQYGTDGPSSLNAISCDLSNPFGIGISQQVQGIRRYLVYTQSPYIGVLACQGSQLTRPAFPISMTVQTLLLPVATTILPSGQGSSFRTTWLPGVLNSLSPVVSANPTAGLSEDNFAYGVNWHKPKFIVTNIEIEF